MYSHSILDVFVVLLATCLKWLTNTRTPHVLVHMVVMHTVFYYELVAQGSSCTQSLCHVHFHFSPASWSLYWISEMSLTGIARAFYWQALMDLYALRWISSEATRSLNVRITPLNNDFTALLFWEAKWPSASSTSTVTIVSCAKTKMPTCLYCTDNNFI